MKKPNAVHIDPSCQFIDTWPVSFGKKTPGSITYSLDAQSVKTVDVSEYEKQISELQTEVISLKNENEELTVKLNDFEKEIEDLNILLEDDQE